MVSELTGSGVRLGQQEWIRERAILWLHDLKTEELKKVGQREGKYKVRVGMEKMENRRTTVRR